MKLFLNFAVTILTLAVTSVFAKGDHKGGHDKPATEHKISGHDGAAHSHDKRANYGKPGNPAKVNRTIKVTALDAMRFDPATFTVKAGETVRFVVTNTGKIDHEFALGDAESQREHAEMMKKMPGMKHEEANAVTIPPGQAKEVVWQFAKPGKVEVGCHLPGHYEAGMKGDILVGKPAKKR